MITWRQDGKELYFMTRNWEVMAVEVTTTPTFKAGAPRLLFRSARSAAGKSDAVEERQPGWPTVHLRDADADRPRRTLARSRPGRGGSLILDPPRTTPGSVISFRLSTVHRVGNREEVMRTLTWLDIGVRDSPGVTSAPRAQQGEPTNPFQGNAQAIDQGLQLFRLLVRELPRSQCQGAAGTRSHDRSMDTRRNRRAVVPDHHAGHSRNGHARRAERRCHAGSGLGRYRISPNIECIWIGRRRARQRAERRDAVLRRSGVQSVPHGSRPRRTAGSRSLTDRCDAFTDGADHRNPHSERVLHRWLLARDRRHERRTPPARRAQERGSVLAADHGHRTSRSCPSTRVTCAR